MRWQLALQVHEKKQKEKLEIQAKKNYENFVQQKNKNEIENEKKLEWERWIKAWENLKEI